MVLAGEGPQASDARLPILVVLPRRARLCTGGQPVTLLREIIGKHHANELGEHAMFCDVDIFWGRRRRNDRYSIDNGHRSCMRVGLRGNMQTRRAWGHPGVA